MDAVQKAGSGHPGTPMAMAPVAYCLCQRYVGSEVLGVETFGASAPLAALQKRFGFTPERVAEAAKKQLRCNS